MASTSSALVSRWIWVIHSSLGFRSGNIGGRVGVFSVKTTSAGERDPSGHDLVATPTRRRVCTLTVIPVSCSNALTSGVGVWTCWPLKGDGVGGLAARGRNRRPATPGRPRFPAAAPATRRVQRRCIGELWGNIRVPIAASHVEVPGRRRNDDR